MPGSRGRSKSHFYINISSLHSDSSSPPPSGHSHGSSVPSPSSHYLDQVGADVGKPKGNTLLHLFGGWLFTAAIWPCTLVYTCTLYIQSGWDAWLILIWLTTITICMQWALSKQLACEVMSCHNCCLNRAHPVYVTCIVCTGGLTCTYMLPVYVLQ